MNDSFNKNKIKLLKGIAWFLTIIIIIYSLFLLTLFINNIITVDSIIGSSPFTGSLLGALVTGLLAIFVSNIEHRRLRKKDKEESKKTYKQLKQYLSLMNFEFDKIINKWEEFHELPVPFEIQEYEDGYVSKIQLVSPDEEKQILYQQDQINKKVSIYASEIITYSIYFFEININDLESSLLDEYLKINGNIRVYAIPKIKKLIDNGVSSLSEEEIKNIKKLFK